MTRVRCPAEFKAEAVRQVSERDHGVVEVSKRLGVSEKSLYATKTAHVQAYVLNITRCSACAFPANFFNNPIHPRVGQKFR